MIDEPITKTAEITMSIKVCPISRMNFNYEENGGGNAFLANPKHQYRVSQYEEHDCSANNIDMEIITSIQVYLISWININYKENGGKQSFSCKSKASRSRTLI